MSAAARWQPRGFAIAIVGVVGFLLAGCTAGGSGNAEHSTSQPERSGSEDLSGWLASEDTSVIYLDYHERDEVLNGTLQVSSLKSGDLGWEVKGQNKAFTGSVDGSDLSIQLDSSPPWFGSLQGDRMTLNLPQDDGTLAAVGLTPASVADYNKAVDQLRQQAKELNSQDAAAANETSQQKELAATETAFDAAMTNLASAADEAGADAEGSTLASYDLALAGYEEAWEAMQSADSDMRSAECLNIGFAADDVGFARDSVGFARDTLNFVDDDADAASERVDTAITDSEEAYDTFVAASTAADSAAPTREAFDALIANGREAQEGLESKREAASVRADEIDTAADALNMNARSWADNHGC